MTASDQDTDQDLAAAIATKVIELLGYERRPLARCDDSVDDRLVFVSSSFAPELEPAYLAIAAAAQAVGLRAERVKDVSGAYRITDRMAMIRSARFVVADVTHERPSVYFELGYAHGLGKTVITILRTGATPHFDVRDWPCLEYFDSRPLEIDLLERLRLEIEARGELARPAAGARPDVRHVENIVRVE